MKRFLHFFLLAACFITTAQVFAATRTVYFDNQDNWAEIHIYYWSDTEGPAYAWPGVQLTDENLTEDGLYKYEINDDKYDKVIFNNNNGSQTDDLTIIDGQCYDSKGIAGTVTVYFDNYKTNWSNVYVHYWGKKFSNWPGVEITNHHNGVYSIEIPVNIDGFLFDDGNSESGNKTFDLTGSDKFEKIYYNTDGRNFPLNVYMIGDIKLYDEEETHIWENTWNGAQLSYEGSGIYKIERIEMLPRNEIDMTSQFRFITNLDSDWNNNGTNYIAKDDNQFTDGATSNVTEKTGDDNNWVYETKKCDGDHYSTIDLILNLDEMKLSSTASTGVESITEDNTNAPAEYYNLQGVKVNNPENGLYIVRQGNKVSKQYIR